MNEKLKTKFIEYDLEDKQIWLHKEVIDTETAKELIRILHHIDSIDKKKSGKIKLRINCSGGDVSSVLAIIDNIAILKTKVDSLIEGEACSGAAILASCVSGTRYITKNSSYMLHGITYNDSSPGKALDQRKCDNAHMEQLIDRVSKLICKKASINYKELQIIFSQDVDMYYSPKDCIKLKLLDKIL